MFSNCSALSSVRVEFTVWPNNGSTNWLNNVSPIGIFYKPTALPEIRGANYIPQGWTVVNYDAVDCSPALPTAFAPLGATLREA